MSTPTPWPEGELLAFDLETTGVDRWHDVPVSYALISFRGAEAVSPDTGIVDPGRDIPEEAARIHGITTERARAEGIPLEDAIAKLSAALTDASSRGVPIVGMNLSFDLTILDAQCLAHGMPGLAATGVPEVVLDVLVLDRHVDRYRKGRRQLGDLCTHYGVELGHAHDAEADAVGTVGVLLEIARQYDEIADFDLRGLHEAEAVWHRDWAEGYDSWRRSKGQTPLDPRDFRWPIAPEAA